MSDFSDLVGRQIDQFRIDEFIARGPMGLILKAFDTVLVRTVALKLIPKRIEAILSAVEAAGMETARRRLVQEATAAGRLTHPNIVTIYSYGETNEFEFICMEYVSGQTLAHILQADRILSPETAVFIFTQVLMALEAAHKEQIMHRDLKPSNIMVTDEKRVKVMDFGIAKLPSLSATMAMSRTVLGIPHYMSPEQISGQKIDIRSDIFSLGAVLYESVTGQKPFSGENTATLAYKIVQTDPVPPRVLNLHLPPALEAIIIKALAKDPAQRFQTPTEMMQELELVTGEAAIPAQVGIEEALSNQHKLIVNAQAGQEDALLEASAVKPNNSGTGPAVFSFRKTVPAAECGIQEERIPIAFQDGGAESTKSVCLGSEVRDGNSGRPSEPLPPSPPSEWGLKMPSGCLLGVKKAVQIFPKTTVGIVLGVFLCVFSVALVKKIPDNPAPVPVQQAVDNSSNWQAESFVVKDIPPQGEPLASTGQSSPAAPQSAPVSVPDKVTAEELISLAKAQFDTNPANVEKLLNEAIGLEPENFEGYLQLGRLLTFRKDYNGAIQQYQKALQINNRLPEVYFNLGYIYMNQGAFDKARKNYEYCLAFSTSFKDEVLTNLGTIELKTGNKTRAREHFLAALELNAGNKLARKYLTKLDERASTQ
jgi:eukaryotic-like serine/threonine-protein kinase